MQGLIIRSDVDVLLPKAFLKIRNRSQVTKLCKSSIVLAVDGSVTLKGKFRAQVGDSFIITNAGYQQITHHSKAIEDIILI